MGLKWFADFIREKRSQMVKASARPGTKSEFNGDGMNVPFVGSDLKSSKKESMASILAKTVREKQKTSEDIITISEVYETIRQLEDGQRIPTDCEMFPEACWNALWEMEDEGLIVIHYEDGPSEDWITIVPNTVFAKLIGF